MKGAWERGHGQPLEVLKRVSEDSIFFNTNVFGSIFRRKRHIEARLKGVQRRLEIVDSGFLSRLELQLQREYDTILFQEELHWFQKSREQWVKLGDRNMAFFHAQTIVRRRRNKVHGLTLPNGLWCTDQAVLQDEALYFFKTLFCSPPSNNRPPMPPHYGPCLDDEVSRCLLHPITKEEVSHALNSMKPYKAPSPDGYQGIFFKQYWYIVGDDVWKFVRDAFATGTFDPHLTETLICLIPKVDPPSNFKEFRPISLCNTMYKVISKVLVNKIRPLLNDLIGLFQGSFILGRGTSVMLLFSKRLSIPCVNLRKRKVMLPLKLI